MTSFRFAMALTAMVLVSTATVKATDLTVGGLDTGDALGSASATRFSYPMSVEVLPGDEVALVADHLNKRIVNVSLADGATNEFMSTGTSKPQWLAVCHDGVGYFSADSVQEFDTSDTSPSATPWVPATTGRGLACLKNSTHNLLFVTDWKVGIRAYDRTNGPPADASVFVWEATVADLGVSGLAGISLSPDLQHLAFADDSGHKVGTINLETNAKQLYGSGTSGDQDGTADVAEFSSPWDVAWTPYGFKILVNQMISRFSNLRFIDFATGDVTSSDGLMPTGSGRGVTVLRSTGEVVMTYQHGLKKMQVAGVNASPPCSLADLDLAQFPLAANKPSSDFPFGQLTVLDQCVPGYTASGNLTIECGAGGWTLQDNSFRCTDTILAQLIAQLQAANELQTTTIDAVKADVVTNAANTIDNVNSVDALQSNITQVQSAVDDLATETSGKFTAVQNDLTAIQDDVTVLQGSASTQAGAITAIQNEITDDVKASIAQNDATLDAHNASITQAQQDITALQQADLQASTRMSQIAANVTQAKTEITQVEQQVIVVDTKADKAKTSGEQNARTVEDVQDEASTDNGSALAIGVIALLIGIAACAGAIFFVLRNKKSKADTQSNQQADSSLPMDLTPAVTSTNDVEVEVDSTLAAV